MFTTELVGKTVSPRHVVEAMRCAPPYVGAELRFAPYVVRSWGDLEVRIDADLDADLDADFDAVDEVSSSVPPHGAVTGGDGSHLSRGSYTRAAPPLFGADFRFAPYEVRS